MRHHREVRPWKSGPLANATRRSMRAFPAAPPQRSAAAVYADIRALLFPAVKLSLDPLMCQTACCHAYAVARFIRESDVNSINPLPTRAVKRK